MAVLVCLVAYSQLQPAFAAMPANPNLLTETQPDGTKIALRFRGDAYSHWLEDTNGFPVVRANNSYVYATVSDGVLVPTSLLVGQSDPTENGLLKRYSPQPATHRLALPQTTNPLQPTRTAVPRGAVKNVVLLMRFADHATRPLPSLSDLEKVFNSPGGDPDVAPSGSVRDYYLETSYGALTLNSVLFGWVTLPHTEAYYADHVSGMGTGFRQAIRDALQLADPLIDFKQFDQDDDGFVDAIAFLHSGYGAEWGSKDPAGAQTEDRIWSHRAQIFDWTSAEGVKVRDYHVSPALRGLSGTKPTHIGVICHETGHFFGLPDLNDTDGTSFGVGSWCLMGNPWGFTGDQRFPPQLSAWCKMQLGWATPTLLQQSGSYTLAQAETNPQVFMITNGYPRGEYLLIENRQPVGFDRYIEQGGLAIWHIDENNIVNNDEGYPGQPDWPGNGNHYKVALLQADGLYDLEKGMNTGDWGDLYSTETATELGPTTSPATDSYAQAITSTGNHLFGISASAPQMNFNFSTSSPTALRITSLQVSPSGLQLSFAGPAAATVILSASADLIHWTPLATNTIPATGVLSVTDPAAVRLQRFFKVASAAP